MPHTASDLPLTVADLPHTLSDLPHTVSDARGTSSRLGRPCTRLSCMLEDHVEDRDTLASSHALVVQDDARRDHVRINRDNVMINRDSDDKL